VQLVVNPDEVGCRLDRYLTERTALSRSQIGLRIRAGDVTINDQPPTKVGHRLQAGDVVSLTIPPPAPSTAIPEDIPLTIVFEDEHLVVIHKPAGMVVHPSPGHHSGTLVNALVHRYGTLAPEATAPMDGPRPGIVHRLDRDTTGLIVVARSVAARDHLSKQFSERSASRRYLAIVHGPRLNDKGTFDTLHGRHHKDRKRFSSKVPKGRQAITHWTVLARANHVALVECALQTGRTHQIRVHFFDHGHPIVGDSTYGGSHRVPGPQGQVLSKLTHQALHAYRLTLTHPITNEEMTFQALPTGAMADAIEHVFGTMDELLPPAPG